MTHRRPHAVTADSNREAPSAETNRLVASFARIELAPNRLFVQRLGGIHLLRPELADAARPIGAELRRRGHGVRCSRPAMGCRRRVGRFYSGCRVLVLLARRPPHRVAAPPVARCFHRPAVSFSFTKHFYHGNAPLFETISIRPRVLGTVPSVFACNVCADRWLRPEQPIRNGAYAPGRGGEYQSASLVPPTPTACLHEIGSTRHETSAASRRLPRPKPILAFGPPSTGGRPTSMRIFTHLPHAAWRRPPLESVPRSTPIAASTGTIALFSTRVWLRNCTTEMLPETKSPAR